jgi:glycosyltransferase involved in cell wall biosynthesis
MRVLQVLATSAGGVGRHVRDLAAGLAAEGVDVRVAAPAATGAAFGLAGAGFTAVEIADRPRPVADLLATLRLRRAVRDVDVVHAHGLRAGALAVLATRTLPRRRRGGSRPAVVVTLHNALVSGGRGPRVQKAVHGGLERVVARADAVLGVSADLVAAMARRGARRTDLAVVPAPPLPPPRRDRDAVRAELGVPPGAALVLTVARLAPQKGLPVLADAIDVLRATHPGLRVHAAVAGDGPLAGELRGRALHLLGNRDDVADLLAGADVVAVPSLWEGQSLALREALRAGAAIVATDAGGNRAVAGDAAAFARPGDPRDLAERLAAVLADGRTADVLRRNALVRAGSLPTASEAVRQVMTWYDTVATRPAEVPRRPSSPG